MRPRPTPALILLLLFGSLSPACRDARNDKIPQLDVERDTGVKDRRGFVVYSGGSEIGAIFQKGTRFVERAGGTYEIQDQDGRLAGYIDGYSGEVHTFRGPGDTGKGRKIDTVDVTTDAGLAHAAEAVLELPRGAVIRRASRARMQSRAIKAAGKSKKKP